MLKWSVTNRRTCDVDIDALRHLSDESVPGVGYPAPVSAVRRSGGHVDRRQRRSLGSAVSHNKENNNRRSLNSHRYSVGFLLECYEIIKKNDLPNFL